MPDEAIICQFVYTTQEFKQAFRVSVSRRRTRWIIGGVLLFVFAMNFWETYSSYGSPSDMDGPVDPSASSFLLSLFYSFLPIVFVVIFLACWISFVSRRAFRKGLYFNQEVTYCFDESGIKFRSALVGVDLVWAAISHFAENGKGFYYSFIGNPGTVWLPKSGFSSPENIEQLRLLVRKHVKKPRLLSTKP